MKRCAGAIHNNDAHRNDYNTLPISEIIDLETIGPYQYIFYIDEYEPNYFLPMDESESHTLYFFSNN